MIILFVINTGGMFRSYVLGVMSPARFLCATPVYFDTNRTVCWYPCHIIERKYL
jgi:hypothetical protein